MLTKRMGGKAAARGQRASETSPSFTLLLLLPKPLPTTDIPAIAAPQQPEYVDDYNLGCSPFY